MFLLIKKSPRATFGLVTCGSFCPDPRQAEQREDENASVHQAQENRRTQVHSVTSGRMDSQDRLPGRTDHSRQACGRHARARARASGQSLLEVSGIQSHADRCGGGGVCVCCAQDHSPGRHVCLLSCCGPPGTHTGVAVGGWQATRVLRSPLSRAWSKARTSLSYHPRWWPSCPGWGWGGKVHGGVWGSSGSHQVKRGDDCWETDATQPGH